MSKLIAIRLWFMPFVVVITCFIVTKFFVDDYSYLLILSLLFLPFLDRDWKLPKLANERRVVRKYVWLLLSVTLVLLLVLPSHAIEFTRTFFIVALPEEWFFRAYLLTRFGGDTRANIASSVAFSLLHAITRGPAVAVEVFIPSLVFGFIYQKTRSILLCIFAHAISNLVFITMLEQYLDVIRSWFSYA